MVSSVLESTISESAATPGIPDAKTIRDKYHHDWAAVHRQVQHRCGGCPTRPPLPQHAWSPAGASYGDGESRLGDTEESDLQDHEETLVDRYTNLVPPGYAILKLDGARDPRLVEDRPEQPCTD